MAGAGDVAGKSIANKAGTEASKEIAEKVAKEAAKEGLEKGSSHLIKKIGMNLLKVVALPLTPIIASAESLYENWDEFEETGKIDPTKQIEKVGTGLGKIFNMSDNIFTLEGIGNKIGGVVDVISGASAATLGVGTQIGSVIKDAIPTGWFDSVFSTIDSVIGIDRTPEPIDDKKDIKKTEPNKELPTVNKNNTPENKTDIKTPPPIITPIVTDNTPLDKINTTTIDNGKINNIDVEKTDDTNDIFDFNKNNPLPVYITNTPLDKQPNNTIDNSTIDIGDKKENNVLNNAIELAKINDAKTIVSNQNNENINQIKSELINEFKSNGYSDTQSTIFSNGELINAIKNNIVNGELEKTNTDDKNILLKKEEYGNINDTNKIDIGFVVKNYIDDIIKNELYTKYKVFESNSEKEYLDRLSEFKYSNNTTPIEQGNDIITYSTDSNDSQNLKSLESVMNDNNTSVSSGDKNTQNVKDQTIIKTLKTLYQGDSDNIDSGYSTPIEQGNDIITYSTDSNDSQNLKSLESVMNDNNTSVSSGDKNTQNVKDQTIIKTLKTLYQGDSDNIDSGYSTPIEQGNDIITYSTDSNNSQNLKSLESVMNDNNTSVSSGDKNTQNVKDQTIIKTLKTLYQGDSDNIDSGYSTPIEQGNDIITYSTDSNDSQNLKSLESVMNDNNTSVSSGDKNTQNVKDQTIIKTLKTLYQGDSDNIDSGYSTPIEQGNDIITYSTDSNDSQNLKSLESVMNDNNTSVSSGDKNTTFNMMVSKMAANLLNKISNRQKYPSNILNNKSINNSGIDQENMQKVFGNELITKQIPSIDLSDIKNIKIPDILKTANNEIVQNYLLSHSPKVQSATNTLKTIGNQNLFNDQTNTNYELEKYNLPDNVLSNMTDVKSLRSNHVLGDILNNNFENVLSKHNTTTNKKTAIDLYTDNLNSFNNRSPETLKEYSENKQYLDYTDTNGESYNKIKELSNSRYDSDVLERIIFDVKKQEYDDKKQNNQQPMIINNSNGNNGNKNTPMNNPNYDIPLLTPNSNSIQRITDAIIGFSFG